MLQEKWSSRKLFAFNLHYTVCIVLPVAYKYMEISETVLLTVLGCITGMATAYFGFNVLQKKFVGPQE